VSTGFGSLRHHKVASSLDGGPSLVPRSDLPGCQSASGVNPFNQPGLRIVVEELDNPTVRSRRFHRGNVQERHQKVDPDRTARPLGQGCDRNSNIVGRNHHQIDHAKPPGVGYRRGKLRGGRAAHARLLQRNGTADQSGKSSVEHVHHPPQAVVLPRLLRTKP
jgi:hypothetical protein